MNENYPLNKQAVHPSTHCYYDSDLFLDIDNVSSATECTGLMPTPPQDQAEADFYTDLYPIPTPNVTKKSKKS